MQWGWVLGPVGMLCAVPLTVILKMLLEHSDDMHWVATLLSDDEPGGSAQLTKPEPMK